MTFLNGGSAANSFCSIDQKAADKSRSVPKVWDMLQKFEQQMLSDELTLPDNRPIGLVGQGLNLPFI